jgi:hypothetical protein
MQDIPNDLYEILTDNQKMQVDVAKNKQPYIDNKGLSEFLSNITFPFSMIDFEACSRAIPLFKGMKPNQFIAFQYNLQIVDKVNNELSVVKTNDFLNKDLTDPRGDFIRNLVENIPKTGSVGVWSAPFERTRLLELAKDFPQYKDDIDNIVSRLVDLEYIFSKYVYFHEFCGSSSIKKVMPVMCPDLSYDDLNIKNGDDAQAKYESMINMSGEEKEVLYNDLLKYCERDTYGMVAIYFSVLKLVSENFSLLEESHA